MSKAKDPIFAPITYADDRQITRTKRGLNCIEEMMYNPDIVYLKCLSCGYEWEMSKSDYISGYCPDKDTIKNNKNIGIGGTGNTGIYKYYEWHNFDELDFDCCTGGIGQCAYIGQQIKIADYYPATGCLDENGYLTGGTGSDGLWTGETGENGEPISDCLGDATSMYMTCIGTSGDSPTHIERTFGGYPLSCPNCCKVNFQALWIERHANDALNDPQYLYDHGYSSPFLNVEELGVEVSSTKIPVCNAIIVIDVQRIKSHFEAA